MNAHCAERLRVLVVKGDELVNRLKRVRLHRRPSRAKKLEERIREIEREIAEVRAESMRRDEIVALKARSCESEHAYDAWLAALETSGRWREFVEAASAEIERLLPLKLRRTAPSAHTRLERLVERHNRALEASRRQKVTA